MLNDLYTWAAPSISGRREYSYPQIHRGWSSGRRLPSLPKELIAPKRIFPKRRTAGIRPAARGLLLTNGHPPLLYQASKNKRHPSSWYYSNRVCLAMEMEALLAKTNRLLQVARDTHPPQPDTVQRLGVALLGAVRISHANTRCAALLMRSMDEEIDVLTSLRREVDELTALLQEARRLFPSTTTTHSSSSAAAHLAGLHGDDLFRALMALHLWPGTTPPDVYLEAALAAQRLLMHDRLHKFLHLYEKILSERNAVTANEIEDSMKIFESHVQTLEKYVRRHVELAAAVAAAASPPSTGPAN